MARRPQLGWVLITLAMTLLVTAWPCAGVRRGPVSGFVPPVRAVRAGWTTRARVRRSSVAEVQDVEDESQSTSESLLVDKAASEEAVDPKKRSSPLWTKESMEISSRTLRAFKNAELESRSLITKASEGLKAFGAYAVSRAAADSELLLRVGVVVASEIVTLLARPLLPSTAGSPATVGTNSTEGASLSLREKMELVSLGIFPVDTRTRQFMVSSFSSAGDDASLLADMAARERRARGLTLSSLPKPLALLRVPLKAIAALPALPLKALKAADAAHGLNRRADERQPTRQIAEAISKPMVPLLASSIALGKELLLGPGPANAAELPAGPSTRRQGEDLGLAMEPSAMALQGREERGAAVLRRAGATAAAVAEGDARAVRLTRLPRGGASSRAANGVAADKGAGGGALALAWDTAREGDVSSGAGTALSAYRAAAAAGGADDWRPLELVSEEEGVIEASAWTAVEQEEAGGGEVVVAGAVKVLDVLLLVLEALVLDIIPKFLKGAQVAGARAMDAVQMNGGGRGLELLPAFRKDMVMQRSIARR